MNLKWFIKVNIFILIVITTCILFLNIFGLSKDLIIITFKALDVIDSFTKSIIITVDMGKLTYPYDIKLLPDIIAITSIIICFIFINFLVRYISNDKSKVNNIPLLILVVVLTITTTIIMLLLDTNLYKYKQAVQNVKEVTSVDMKLTDVYEKMFQFKETICIGNENREHMLETSLLTVNEDNSLNIYCTYSNNAKVWITNIPYDTYMNNGLIYMDYIH